MRFILRRSVERPEIFQLISFEQERQAMKRTAMSIGVWVWTLVLVSTTGIQAQIAEDMIFHNGKIVTVDDPGFNSQVGTIAQAMHVQDGKIVQLGASAEILTLAGPDTKVMDLKGRMVLPGLILTHEHP